LVLVLNPGKALRFQPLPRTNDDLQSHNRHLELPERIRPAQFLHHVHCRSIRDCCRNLGDRVWNSWLRAGKWTVNLRCSINRFPPRLSAYEHGRRHVVCGSMETGRSTSVDGWSEGDGKRNTENNHLPIRPRRDLSDLPLQQSDRRI